MASNNPRTINGVLNEPGRSDGNSSETSTIPLAIVGMACRFAGGVSSPEKLWEFVSKGKSAWSKVPETRFNMPAFHHDQADKVGSVSGEIGVTKEKQESEIKTDPQYWIDTRPGRILP